MTHGKKQRRLRRGLGYSFLGMACATVLTLSPSTHAGNRSTTEEGGWGCDGSGGTAACWTCCYKQGEAVYYGCIRYNGSPQFCDAEKRSASKACKSESC